MDKDTDMRFAVLKKTVVGGMEEVGGKGRRRQKELPRVKTREEISRARRD